MLNIVCCESCGFGKGDTSKEEIEEQKEKYSGIYICKDCETTIENLANGEFGKFESDGRTCLVTDDGIYIDKGMQPRGTRWLGFGGRLFLIVKTVKDEFSTKKKVYLTNNLYNIKSIHPCLKDKYKHNINAEIISVDWDGFNILKKQLDKI